MKQASLVFVIRTVHGVDEVCLATKVKKVGIGRLNGYGGKQEPEETMRECACRETKDESGGKNDPSKGIVVQPKDLEKVGFIEFHLGPNEPAIWVVHVYTARVFKGTPESTDEMMNPEWFPKGALPFDRMQAGDILFLKPILSQGKKVSGPIWYTDKGTSEIHRHELKYVDSLEE